MSARLIRSCCLVSCVLLAAAALAPVIDRTSREIPAELCSTPENYGLFEGSLGGMERNPSGWHDRIMQHFHDIAYRHAGDMTFMTFRVSETVLATGGVREQRGIESYTFRDGRLATKDVYRKPVAG